MYGNEPLNQSLMIMLVGRLVNKNKVIDSRR